MFELKPSHTKCISEDVKANGFSSGSYNVVNPNNVGTVPDHHKISVKVWDSILFGRNFNV